MPDYTAFMLSYRISNEPFLQGSLALGFPPIARDRYEQMIGPDDYSLKIEDVQLSDEDEFECQITPHGMRSQVIILYTFSLKVV